jgi:hypothetical protein
LAKIRLMRLLTVWTLRESSAAMPGLVDSLPAVGGGGHDIDVGQEPEQQDEPDLDRLMRGVLGDVDQGLLCRASKRQAGVGRQ